MDILAWLFAADMVLPAALMYGVLRVEHWYEARVTPLATTLFITYYSVSILLIIGSFSTTLVFLMKLATDAFGLGLSTYPLGVLVAGTVLAGILYALENIGAKVVCHS